MKNILKILAILIGIYILVFSCNKLVSKKLETKIDEKISVIENGNLDEINSTIEILSKNLPRRIDENTTLKNIEFNKNENKLTFEYIINDVTNEDVLNYLPTLKNNQINYIKENPNNRAFINQKVDFEYFYKDINNTLIGSFNITPNDYL